MLSASRTRTSTLGPWLGLLMLAAGSLAACDRGGDAEGKDGEQQLEATARLLLGRGDSGVGARIEAKATGKVKVDTGSPGGKKTIRPDDDGVARGDLKFSTQDLGKELSISVSSGDTKTSLPLTVPDRGIAYNRVTQDWKCTGVPLKERCSFDLAFGPTPQLVVEQYIPGAKLTHAGKSVTVADDGSATLPVDPGEILESGKNLGNAIGKGTAGPNDMPEASVLADLTLPGGDDALIDLRLSKALITQALAAHLRGVPGKGISFAKEGKGNALLLTYSDDTATRSFGKASTLGDIGRVAIATVDKKEGSCGSYVNAKGLGFKVGTKQINLDVTVYDRRTGKSLGQKTFEADAPLCPKTKKFSGGKWVVGTVDAEDVAKWAQGL